MIKCSCIFVMLSLTVALSNGQPIPDESKKDKADGSLFNLPFLQFGNGGVRVNFAGYHAEAGLGGLLGDSTKGGLYAGAGTPFGAHASADLGGDLGAENGGGGLRARAGLGNGRPEAAAGLGGNLDGANGANSGTLYAGSSNGIKTKIVTKNVGSDQTNIQIIPKKPGDDERGMKRRDIDFKDEKINAVEPIPVPVINEAPIYSAYPSRRCRRKRICNNFLQKAVQYQQLPGNQITPDFGIPNPVPDFDAALPGGKGIDARGYASVEFSKGVSAAATGYSDVAVAPGPAPSPPSTSPPAPTAAPAPTYSHPHPYPVPVRAPTLFDHIFNIPISTLAAVNQLLNSKVG